MRKRYRVLAVAAAVAMSAPDASGATSSPCVPGGPYSQTWATSNVRAVSVGNWSNQTLRELVHTSSGGTQLRIHLTNEFATSTVTFGHVSVGQQLNQAQTVESPVTVTFGGVDSVTLAPGAEVVSDPMPFTTTASERLLVSLYLTSSDNVTSAPVHDYANETEYNILGRDASAMQKPAVSNTFSFTAYLAGVDVESSSAQTVVAAGDSVTDTAGTPYDTDTRWTDDLSHRTGLAVVNQGISGNWVTRGAGTGQALTDRWQHDVLDTPGIRSVIDEGGINDLRNGVSASTLEAAQASLVASAHAAGARIELTTITPCAGDSLCNAAFEQNRAAYNAWVRSGASGADGVVDFDSAVSNGSALAAAYDDGGHLHPNSAGTLAMSNEVDVTKL